MDDRFGGGPMVDRLSVSVCSRLGVIVIMIATGFVFVGVVPIMAVTMPGRTFPCLASRCGQAAAGEFNAQFFFEKFSGDLIEGARRHLRGGNAQVLGSGQHGSVVQAQLFCYLVYANGHTAFLLKFDRPATA
jgi:hypothetical protein